MLVVLSHNLRELRSTFLLTERCETARNKKIDRASNHSAAH
jgi:hypothetical protein